MCPAAAGNCASGNRVAASGDVFCSAGQAVASKLLWCEGLEVLSCCTYKCNVEMCMHTGAVQVPCAASSCVDLAS
jgi:hypothetical protein